MNDTLQRSTPIQRYAMKPNEGYRRVVDRENGEYIRPNDTHWPHEHIHTPTINIACANISWGQVEIYIADKTWSGSCRRLQVNASALNSRRCDALQWMWICFTMFHRPMTSSCTDTRIRAQSCGSACTSRLDAPYIILWRYATLPTLDTKYCTTDRYASLHVTTRGRKHENNADCILLIYSVLISWY